MKWKPYIGPEPKKGAAHPIHGQRRGRRFDPIKWTYIESRNTYFSTSLFFSGDFKRDRLNRPRDIRSKAFGDFEGAASGELTVWQAIRLIPNVLK